LSFRVRLASGMTAPVESVTTPCTEVRYWACAKLAEKSVIETTRAANAERLNHPERAESPDPLDSLEMNESRYVCRIVPPKRMVL
jgi:hypothetical protein